MKVSFNTFNPYTAQAKTRKTGEELSFRAQMQNIRFSDIKKITSEAEYDRIFNSLRSRGLGTGWWKKGDKYEQGLMPYIGEQDISARINSFLTYGTSDSKFSTTTLENIVKIMEYALGKIDETFGKYEGFVYRCGRVSKESKRFVSTARDPNGVTALIDEDNRRNFKRPLHIIYTKNGHKIEEIQKKLNYNNVYTEESEILISPTRFEEITEITPEMQEAKEKFTAALRKKHIYPSNNIIFLREAE